MNEFLDALTLARWQFGLTTLYHFLFVPLTIGLSFLVAILQTAWVRTGKVKYLRLTKLYGKVFLINFAMGVVTGIVQEFQFGMNWSNYSRFVGDIFGAPLAVVEFRLIVKAVKAGPPEIGSADGGDAADDGDVDHSKLATVY